MYREECSFVRYIIYGNIRRGLAQARALIKVRHSPVAIVAMENLTNNRP